MCYCEWIGICICAHWLNIYNRRETEKNWLAKIRLATDTILYGWPDQKSLNDFYLFLILSTQSVPSHIHTEHISFSNFITCHLFCQKQKMEQFSPIAMATTTNRNLSIYSSYIYIVHCTCLWVSANNRPKSHAYTHTHISE